ncbi:hypothetical protein [Brevundimonas sp.]|uniref:hypothetical protein n=1 Tax=Brevundimonas sp. TaxID=1871086 RepID=UPI002C331EB3|nr:hypothetical protein [Brevundimonas sp.]HWQ88096.1 hypothetical protein [Brevundimonas sp.]
MWSFGRLAGEGTFLSDEIAEEVMALVALDLMSRALRVGMTRTSQIALRHVVLAWMKQRRSGESEPRLVTVRPDDLATLNGQRLKLMNQRHSMPPYLPRTYSGSRTTAASEDERFIPRVH